MITIFINLTNCSQYRELDFDTKIWVYVCTHVAIGVCKALGCP